jgi:putative ABC transport system substrate-binding protein
MISRREWILGVAAGTLMSPLGALAQPKVFRIGRLAPATPSFSAPMEDALKQGLRELGWVEGRNFVMEYRFAHGKSERLPGLAAELVRLKVDVIVAGSSPGVLAARSATATIPIVMVTTGDPVAGGLVGDLSHPGGNVTGVTALNQNLNAKLLEILKETVPRTSRVAVLGGAAYPSKLLESDEIRRAVGALGITLHRFDVTRPSELERTFVAMTKRHAEALFVVPDPMFNEYQRRIATLALEHRLPAAFGFPGFVDAGGLLYYGAPLPSMYRLAAAYVVKLAGGAKPADLPIEQPTTFELVINLRTARALGLTIPSSILLRADRVIE